jgi:RNA polymerase sigma-70 factor (ECF subfamily)
MAENDLRPLLFSIAYRMLGSASDAEDVVQEAYIRLEGREREGLTVHSERAYLTTVTTRLAIDQLRSARARRETYVGPWLPEPLLTSGRDETADVAEMADSLSMSFLVLLETLSPVERAVFLLREVFDYGYDEIAEVVEKSEANCRQIFVRARRHVDDGRPRFEATERERNRLADRFFAAVEEGEVDGLVDMLAADVVFYGDGGGKGQGLPQPVYGRDKVVRLVSGFAANFGPLGVQVRRAEVNGQPGVLVLDAEDRLISVLTLDIVDGAVQTLQSVVNPDKLGHLGWPLSRVGFSRRAEG